MHTLLAAMDLEKFKNGLARRSVRPAGALKPQRKSATAFRDSVLDDRFQMIQFSVYVMCAPV